MLFSGPRPELPHDLRASTFHPPTLDMLERFGVVGAMIDQGLICPTWQFRDRKDGVVATFELSRLGATPIIPIAYNVNSGASAKCCLRS